MLLRATGLTCSLLGPSAAGERRNGGGISTISPSSSPADEEASVARDPDDGDGAMDAAQDRTERTTRALEAGDTGGDGARRDAEETENRRRTVDCAGRRSHTRSTDGGGSCGGGGGAAGAAAAAAAAAMAAVRRPAAECVRR